MTFKWSWLIGFEHLKFACYSRHNSKCSQEQPNREGKDESEVSTLRARLRVRRVIPFWAMRKRLFFLICPGNNLKGNTSPFVELLLCGPFFFFVLPLRERDKAVLNLFGLSSKLISFFFSSRYYGFFRVALFINFLGWMLEVWENILTMFFLSYLSVSDMSSQFHY